MLQRQTIVLSPKMLLVARSSELSVAGRMGRPVVTKSRQIEPLCVSSTAPPEEDTALFTYCPDGAVVDKEITRRGCIKTQLPLSGKPNKMPEVPPESISVDIKLPPMKTKHI